MLDVSTHKREVCHKLTGLQLAKHKIKFFVRTFWCNLRRAFRFKGVPATQFLGSGGGKGCAWWVLAACFQSELEPQIIPLDTSRSI